MCMGRCLYTGGSYTRTRAAICDLQCLAPISIDLPSLLNSQQEQEEARRWADVAAREFAVQFATHFHAVLRRQQVSINPPQKNIGR